MVQSPCSNTLDLGFNKSLDSRLPKKRSFDLDKFEDEILGGEMVKGLL